MSKRSNVPGFEFGVIPKISGYVSKKLVLLDVEDVHTAGEVIEFLELVHGVRIKAKPSPYGTHVLELPTGTALNLPALRVISWLYGVTASQPQLQ